MSSSPITSTVRVTFRDTSKLVLRTADSMDLVDGSSFRLVCKQIVPRVIIELGFERAAIVVLSPTYRGCRAVERSRQMAAEQAHNPRPSTLHPPLHGLLIFLDRADQLARTHRSVATRLPRTLDVMLRPLLLLCWAATIVSAGDPKNVTINDTSVPTNPAGNNAAAPPQSTSQPILPESNVETKPNQVPSNKDERVTNGSLEPPKVIVPPIPFPSTNPPTTSTTKSTTTSTSTTTAKSTTTAAPTTPAPTTPLPPPSTGKWKVEENNTLCVLVQMAVQFNVSYTNANNVTIYKAMDIPSNSTGTGKCGKTEQNLTLSWDSQNKTTHNNFTIHFVKNETEKYYSLHHFEISLAAEEFPNDKSNKTVTLVHVAPQFKTGLSNSYRCIKEQQMDLTREGNNVTVGLLKVTKLQFQAFRGDNTTIFGLAKDCSYDTPDIVPITVGCALAGLVVIVLIAYLVGRRRSQARGYLSM